MSSWTRINDTFERLLGELGSEHEAITALLMKLQKGLLLGRIVQDLRFVSTRTPPKQLLVPIEFWAEATLHVRAGQTRARNVVLDPADTRRLKEMLGGTFRFIDTMEQAKRDLKSDRRVPRGVRPRQRLRVEAEMGPMSAEELASLTEFGMETRFGASRDTCRKARNAVLGRKNNSDN